MKISKELLSEVLGLKVWKVLGNTECILRYCIYPNKGDEPSEYMFPINIYELAHKCKEWAYNQGYMMAIENHYINSIKIGIRKPMANTKYIEPWKKTFKNEPEAIFKACEWIRTNG